MVDIRDKKYSLQGIAQRIEEARINEIGQPVTFNGFSINDIYSVLETALAFHLEVADLDKITIIRDGIYSAANAGKVNADTLLEQIKQSERSYLSVRPKDFILATSISVAHFAELKRASVNGSSITFSRQLPVSFKRISIQDEIKKVVDINNIDRFTHIRVKIEARTNASAVSKALYNLDYLRGVWNFLINRRTRVQFLYGLQRPRPINSIVLGPIHTLHLPNGTLATEEFWYQSRDLQYDKLYRLSLIWPDIQGRTSKIRQSLNRISYSEKLINWFVRYVRALDNTDPDIAFNKLWAVLELLSNSPGKYE